MPGAAAGGTWWCVRYCLWEGDGRIVVVVVIVADCGGIILVGFAFWRREIWVFI